MANKRPDEEQNEQEKKQEQEKKKSHAELLQKGIAERVTEFLSTQEGKNALAKGKDSFVEAFLQTREKADENMLTSYKELIGKKADEELTLDDLKDVRINYEQTLDSYITTAESSHIAELQEKSVAHAFMQKMSDEIASKHFSQEHRDAWQQYVLSHEKQIDDRSDLERLLKKFFEQTGVVISAEQKKRLQKVSIDFRDVADYMKTQDGFEKEALDKLNKKGIITANTDAESMVKSFLRTYVKTEVAPAYQRQQEKLYNIQSIYKVPGFQKVLQEYDLSVDNLRAHDKAFNIVYANETKSNEEKLIAQQKAIVSLVGKKDPTLASLMEKLFHSNYNLAKLDAKQQQEYIDRFHHMWTNSSEMKVFDELLEQFGSSAQERQELMKQAFDLSQKELRIKDKQGVDRVISLDKKIVDRNRSAENMSESLAHAVPLVFLIQPNETLEKEYVQQLANVDDKNFQLKDADGKDIELFPGNHVEITTKDGKKHTGYIYKDPEGNVFLSEQPGSDKKIEISQKELQESKSRLLDETYVLEPEALPALMTHMALLKEVNARDEQENRDAIDERNHDIAQNALHKDFDKEESLASHESPTDEQIENTNWDNEEAVDGISDEQKKERIAYTDARLKENNKKIEKLDKQIREQDNIIKDLQKELKVAHAKKPLDEEQVQRLEHNLHEAEKKRDSLIDDKYVLSAKNDSLEKANKKLREQKKEKTDDKQEEAAREQSEGKNFHEIWSELLGDKTIDEPIPGKTTFMALLPDATSSRSGGGGVWVRGEIIGYDKDTHTIQVKWHGTEGKLSSKETGENLEGAVSTVHGAEGLSALKRAMGKVYKFKKYSTITQWGLDLKGGVTTADDDTTTTGTHFHFDKKYEGWRNHLKEDINFSSMKNQQTGKDIRYFGKKIGDTRAWYEIDLKGDAVSVREIQIEDEKNDDDQIVKRTKKIMYEQTMPVNDFMMFAMEKDLRGYTQEDVDKANGADEDKSKAGKDYIDDVVEEVAQPASKFGGGLFGLKRGSIAGVMSSWDVVKKGMKNYFDEKGKKEKSKVENAMLNSSWFKGLEKMPILGKGFEDIRGGIESKLDSEKKKRINEYKDEVGTKKDSSSSGASNFIKNMLEDGKTARKEPEKAAGYYLHALEQGNPYFRTLKEFEGTGWWIKQILGDDYQKQYLAYIKTVEEDLKKNPDSKELQNDFSMGELGFMQKVFNTGSKKMKTHLTDMLGNWFFTGGLGQAQYGMRYNSSKIEEVVKNEGAKPFHQLMKDSRTGHYEAFRVNDYMGILKLLSEKVGSNEDYYYQWAGSMLLPLLNGQYRSDMSASYKSIYQQLARQNAFPFAAYITEGNATEKITDLIDIFAGGSLSSAMKDAKKPIDRTKAFKKWRENPNGQARSVLDALQNPKELFAMKEKLKKESADQEKLNQYNILSDYINNKFNDDDRSGITEQVDGESIIYQKNIFSAPTGFVKEQMLNFSNGQFRGRSEKNGPELWSALKTKLNEINSLPEDQMTPDFFEFILKRYFAMFSQKYNGTAKRTFIGTLKYPDLPGIFQLNVRGVFDKKWGGVDLPSEVEDSLVIFEQIFKKFSGLIKQHPEMLGDVFDDARMVDYYKELTPQEMAKKADNMKTLQNKVKEASELYGDEGSRYE